jgi:hypothetical protein
MQVCNMRSIVNSSTRSQESSANFEACVELPLIADRERNPSAGVKKTRPQLTRFSLIHLMKSSVARWRRSSTSAAARNANAETLIDKYEK